MNRLQNVLRVFRILLALALLAYVVHEIDEPALLTMLGASFRRHALYWIAALACTYLGLHVGVLRWMTLLNANGIRASFASVFRFFFMGQFFNAFMLGACGGDMARAVAVTRACPNKRAAALSTVVMDRGIGLFITVIAGCAAILFRLPLFDLSKTNRLAAFIMFVFLIGTCAGVMILFGRHVFEHWALFRRLEQSSRFGAWLRRAYEAFYFYRHHPRVVAQAAVYSAVNLFFLTLACLLVGRALDIPVATFDYFTFFPIITVLAALPLTPGSFGVRENLFMAMFGSVGAQPEQAVSLSLAVYAEGLFWSLIGGLIFAFGPARDFPSEGCGEGGAPRGGQQHMQPACRGYEPIAPS